MCALEIEIIADTALVDFLVDVNVFNPYTVEADLNQSVRWYKLRIKGDFYW